MANNEDGNLVSQVQVTGTDESAAALEKYADRGAAAFAKVDKAAAGAAAGVKAAGASVEESAAGAADAVGKLGNTKIDTGNAERLSEITKASFELGNELRKTIKDVGKFAARVAAIGAGAAASAAGVLKLASSIAKQAAGTSDALDKQVQAQTDANTKQLEATQATIGYESAQRKLFQQFQQGAIDYQTYSANLKALAQDFKEQRRVQQELADAADATKEANDRLQKQLADRKAYTALIDTWGGPMLSALTALGNEVNREWELFKQAFGPATAGIIDNILAVLSKNSGAIGKFFDEGSKKIGDFVNKNGPEIQKAITSIGEIMGGIFNGLIDALPTLLNLFNNGIVPAIKGVGAALTTVADLFNAAFGTHVTAGVIAVSTAVLFMTDSFKLLLGVLALARAGVVLLMSLFGPWGLLIAAVAAALIFLATQVDWGKLVKGASDAAKNTVEVFQGVTGAISQFFSDLWSGTVSLASAAVGGIIAAWTAVITFFTTLGANVGAFFANLWNTVMAAGQSAATGITDAWQAVVDFFTSLNDSIGTAFSSIWEGVQSGVAAAVQFVTDAWNGAVAFFQSLPATIGAVFVAVGTAITDAFNTAVQTVEQYLSDLATSAMSYLQPIIDALKAIISLNGQADSGSSGGSQSFAGGGEVRGPGTSTSDSIAAWLSNNEFVMRAKAVKKYGAAFMHAINRGQLDPSRILGFAAGGLVSAFSQPRVSMAPATIPSGGSTAASRILNLTIGDQQFNGLMAPDDVAEKMERFATGRYARSAGRKPSWVGGSR